MIINYISVIGLNVSTESSTECNRYVQQRDAVMQIEVGKVQKRKKVLVLHDLRFV